MSNFDPKRVGLFVAVAIAAVSSAQAQGLVGANETAGGQLEITGIAPEGCVISTPTQGTITNATVTPGPNAAQVTITQLVNPTTAVSQGATVDMVFPVICNTAHNLTISATQGGLALQGGAPAGPGFRNSLEYQVSANWVGQQVSGTSASPVQISVPSAATGQLDVNIAIPAGGVPLVAGTYSDSLIVNIAPAS